MKPYIPSNLFLNHFQVSLLTYCLISSTWLISSKKHEVSLESSRVKANAISGEKKTLPKAQWPRGLGGSYTNVDQISSSEPQPSVNYVQNLNQTSATHWKWLSLQQTNSIDKQAYWYKYIKYNYQDLSNFLTFFDVGWETAYCDQTLYSKSEQKSIFMTKLQLPNLFL